MYRSLLAGLITLFLAVIVHEGGASEFCGNRVVSVGDTTADLVMKCGEPDSKVSRQEEITERFDENTKIKQIVTIEEWSYNFGPAEFIRIFTLKNGVIADIRLGEYGYARDAVQKGKSDCSGRVLSLGESQGEIRLKCGEPSWKETRTEEVKEALDETRTKKTGVTIEEWTYNFGPDRLIRILTFRNGKLADIRTGGYGYERDNGGKR